MNRRTLLKVALPLALLLALALASVVLAQGTGTVTLSFTHIGDNAPIAGGELTLTAPETIGTEHKFLYWLVDGEQLADRTIVLDMSKAADARAVYNPDDGQILVTLQDSDGQKLVGGSLRYHDGAWHTATDIGDGTFSLETDAAYITYEMTYNNGRQTLSNVNRMVDPIFTTVSTKVALQDSTDVDQYGGTVRYHQIGWQDWGAANTTQELLPGNYTFETTYNNGRQTYSTYAVGDEGGGAATVLFKTVTVTPALENSDGTALPDGTVRYHQIGWQDWDDSANTSMELLPGIYTFEMTFNNGRQTFSNYAIPADPAHEVLFTTTSVTPALEDSDHGVLVGGTVRYHQIGWQDWGAANTSRELLPGSYTFEMTFNNGRQTFSNYAIPADPAHKVLFTTVSVTSALKDSDGTVLSDGTVRYHQIGWQDWGRPTRPASCCRATIPSR